MSIITLQAPNTSGFSRTSVLRPQVPSDGADMSRRSFVKASVAAAFFGALGSSELLAQASPAPASDDLALQKALEKLKQSIKTPSLEDRSKPIVTLSRLKNQMDNYNGKLRNVGLLGKDLSPDQRSALYYGTKLIDASGNVTDTPKGKGGIIAKDTGELIRFKTGNSDTTDGMAFWYASGMAYTLIRCEENIEKLGKLVESKDISPRGERKYWIYKSVESICQQLDGIDQNANPKQAMTEYAALRAYLKELGFNVEVSYSSQHKNPNYNISFDKKASGSIDISPIFLNFLTKGVTYIEEDMRLHK